MRVSKRAALAAGGLLAAVCATLLPVQASAAGTDETGGGVAHTWSDFRSAGGVEGPVIQSHQTVSIDCKLHGFPVPNGNDWWYRVASSPWDGQYYVSADAFYNNGQTSGDLKNTPWVDPAVRDCDSQSPEAQSGTVTLQQGVAAPHGYYYDVSVAGFAANASVTASCRDSRDPGGFRTFQIQADQAGNAHYDRGCYSGDGPDHWVVVNGVESNHVPWRVARTDTGSRTNASSNAPAPSADETVPSSTPASSAPETCAKVSGQQVPGDRTISPWLYAHFVEGTGNQVVIPWSYFSREPAFVRKATSLPIGTAVEARNIWSGPRPSDM